jgi:hypothetical protein
MTSFSRTRKEGRDQPHGMIRGERLTMDGLLGNITSISALMIFSDNQARG